uniref:Mitogen-activated protein kinase n=1 Tax=Albugo laibachii Nc14 TaxID=890382 RepID=F0WY47_9STRA|nr:mitogenactivated protein kinase putative [Albugo laibachii Nc14]|eukprot:CCA26397.1 mitogenactivated protein kinase putative [Albugo laibachii Nc14]
MTQLLKELDLDANLSPSISPLPQGQLHSKTHRLSRCRLNSMTTSSILTLQDYKDQETQKCIPIAWEGLIRRKSEWMPRWEEQFMLFRGRKLFFIESRSKLDQWKAYEEQISLYFRHFRPIQSDHKSNTQRDSVPSMDSLIKSLVTRTYTMTHVCMEDVGRSHGFHLCVQEKKSKLHIATEIELERIVWMHLLSAALSQNATDDHAEKLPEPIVHEMVSLTCVRTLLGTPIQVNLVAFYQAWAELEHRRGNFANVIPFLHPNVRITSNYPPSVPISGEFYGLYDGFLAFLTTLHVTMSVSHHRVDHIARRGDLAVISGRESIKNEKNHRCFRHTWKHALRFGKDGRISHIHIVGDKTAAAVAFGSHVLGPSLELPHDQDASTISCPPGTLRVVCISARNLLGSRKRPLSASTALRLQLAVGRPPQLIRKAASCLTYRSLVAAVAQRAQQLVEKNGKDREGGDADSLENSQLSEQFGGFRKVYATSVTKNGKGGSAPFWAESVEIPLSGSVPGTILCLFLEVWSVGVLGDELIGCTKLNLAQPFMKGVSSDQAEMAKAVLPQWYDLYHPDHADFLVRSALPTSNGSCGQIQLSIHFSPYADDTTSERVVEVSEQREMDVVEEALHPNRNSLDRLEELYSVAQVPLEDGEEGCKTISSSRKEEEPEKWEDDFHTFTIASTRFQIYRRYQLIRPIGHGAYGVVIAASDQITGNSVAIKNIPKTFDDLVDAKRIVREIRLMRHLKHPNIVSALDVMRPPSIVDFDDTYIVTELMETDLHRVINSKEPLSSDQIAYITYQMLCALRYMHSAQVIHRDIKPSNILVNRDCLIKICDFGLARGFNFSDQDPDDAMDTNIALTEYVVTRWYRAPELLLASRYSTIIDVWAVGCILIEMFTRRALFPGHDHVHQLSLILQLVGSPKSPEELEFVTNQKARRWIAKQPHYEKKLFASVCPSAPESAVDLMNKLLQFDPRKRISIDKALAHPFLKPYRNAEMFESVADTVFDFGFEQQKSKRSELTQQMLRQLIFEDVCAFHPEAMSELDEYIKERQALSEADEAADEFQDTREESSDASGMS